MTDQGSDSSLTITVDLRELRKEIRMLRVSFYILLALVLLFGSPGLLDRFWYRNGESHWFGQSLNLYNKDSSAGGYNFCEMGVASHASKRVRVGPQAGAEYLTLRTELSEPLVSLYRDMENGGGRIVIYDRGGEVVWQAP
jgi:hypothetical protein